ncbi:MAG: hypothetical protein ACJAWF_003636, partial [Candidatus Azotimanducaceae bacterium]
DDCGATGVFSLVCDREKLIHIAKIWRIKTQTYHLGSGPYIDIDVIGYVHSARKTT